ncbi:MAG: hypothetical protein K9N55_03015 [Phycisphaerae bacterium]|nr:hypothetical protein [Phycisphaerae bacterium]
MALSKGIRPENPGDVNTLEDLIRTREGVSARTKRTGGMSRGTMRDTIC